MEKAKSRKELFDRLLILNADILNGTIKMKEAKEANNNFGKIISFMKFELDASKYTGKELMKGYFEQE